MNQEIVGVSNDNLDYRTQYFVLCDLLGKLCQKQLQYLYFSVVTSRVNVLLYNRDLYTLKTEFYLDVPIKNTINYPFSFHSAKLQVESKFDVQI